jgi:hypothetical protein
VDAILCGGPRHGGVFTLPDGPASLNMLHTIYAAESSLPIDVINFTSGAELESAMMFRRAEYRLRRWGCGNPVCDTSGRAIFDYHGSS